jgi:hypothetical protein
MIHAGNVGSVAAMVSKPLLQFPLDAEALGSDVEIAPGLELYIHQQRRHMWTWEYCWRYCLEQCLDLEKCAYPHLP